MKSEKFDWKGLWLSLLFAATALAIGIGLGYAIFGPFAQ
jgi:hypothetical protein